MAVEGFGWLAGSVGENSGSNSAKKDWGRGSIRADGVALSKVVQCRTGKRFLQKGEELKG